MVAVRFEGD